ALYPLTHGEPRSSRLQRTRPGGLTLARVIACPPNALKSDVPCKGERAGSARELPLYRLLVVVRRGDTSLYERLWEDFHRPDLLHRSSSSGIAARPSGASRRVPSALTGGAVTAASAPRSRGRRGGSSWRRCGGEEGERRCRMSLPPPQAALGSAPC